MQGLEQFAQQVFSMLYTAINNEYPAYTTPLDEDTQSAVQHELMARSVRKIFVGRKDELAQIKSIIADSTTDDENAAVIVTGEDGIGKTALLSQLAADLAEQSDTDVARHFVGANPESFSVINLLQRLCARLAKVL